jgi:hypothetical protein
MSAFRWDIGASAGPAREGLVGGRAQLLVRVRMSDDGVCEPQPDVCCDLRPSEARGLAQRLLAAATDAEQQTAQAGFWEPAG